MPGNFTHSVQPSYQSCKVGTVLISVFPQRRTGAQTSSHHWDPHLSLSPGCFFWVPAVLWKTGRGSPVSQHRPGPGTESSSQSSSLVPTDSPGLSGCRADWNSWTWSSYFYADGSVMGLHDANSAYFEVQCLQVIHIFFPHLCSYTVSTIPLEGQTLLR